MTLCPPVLFVSSFIIAYLCFLFVLRAISILPASYLSLIENFIALKRIVYDSLQHRQFVLLTTYSVTTASMGILCYNKGKNLWFCHNLAQTTNLGQ